jgi:hypothetical protein
MTMAARQNVPICAACAPSHHRRKADHNGGFARGREELG